MSSSANRPITGALVDVYDVVIKGSRICSTDLTNLADLNFGRATKPLSPLRDGGDALAVLGIPSQHTLE